MNEVKRFSATSSTGSREESDATRHAAEKWLEARGFAIGERQRHDPRGLMLLRDYEEITIAKWRNLSKTERRQMDGRLEMHGTSAVIYVCVPVARRLTVAEPVVTVAP